MPGETDLTRLLASLDPVLDDREFGYAIVPHGTTLPAGFHPLGMFHEAEGVTLIAPAADLAAAGIESQTGLARLTMMVQSSLEAVGMTAAMATALTRVGISANVVAAYHHDHIFVPWDRRDEAVAALQSLAGPAQGGGRTS
ncbi:MAG: ACT domain-containing protein [Devosia sp.]